MQRLYAQVTPESVQQAECGQDESKPPILYGESPAPCSRYVLIEEGEITGALHLLRGERGTWLSIWTDTLQVDSRRSTSVTLFWIADRPDRISTDSGLRRSSVIIMVD